MEILFQSALDKHNTKTLKNQPDFLVSFFVQLDKCFVVLVESGNRKGGEMTDKDVEKKVYGAEEIQQILGIGRSKVYLFLDEVYKKKKPFRVLKIGKCYRIPKGSFDRWLEGEAEE